MALNTPVTTPNRAGLFFALLLFWILLSGSFDPVTLGVGAAVSAALAGLSRGGMSFFTDFRFTPRAIWATVLYFGYFLTALAKSNFRLAGLVLAPSLPINPGFVKVRTRLKTPMARLLLANSITLTPGTLTVEIEGEWLYIHWVTADPSDVEGATREIVAGFERYLEVMYG
jgi:multicomponent Na+:H+ antiporter subunit E